MQNILLERIENLGQMGDLVNVKPGYARNFLLPKGKAIRATAENRAKFDAERAQLEADNLAKKADAEKIAQKMDGLSVNLIRAASEMGQLYGSASSRDIAHAATEEGFTIAKNQVDLNTALKTLGIFPVRIILHPEVAVEIKVNIARSEDEAKEQLKLGRAIISDVAEREREEAAIAATEAEARALEQDEEEQEQEAGEDEKAETKTKEKAEPETEAKPKKKKAKAKAKTKAKAKAKAKAKTKTKPKEEKDEAEKDEAEK